MGPCWRRIDKIIGSGPGYLTDCGILAAAPAEVVVEVFNARAEFDKARVCVCAVVAVAAAEDILFPAVDDATDAVAAWAAAISRPMA